MSSRDKKAEEIIEETMQGIFDDLNRSKSMNEMDDSNDIPQKNLPTKRLPKEKARAGGLRIIKRRQTKGRLAIGVRQAGRGTLAGRLLPKRSHQGKLRRKISRIKRSLVKGILTTLTYLLAEMYLEQAGKRDQRTP